MSVVRLRTGACALVISALAHPAFAQSLQPVQQQALDQVLATAAPEIRPVMRAQLAPTLAILNEAQVSMMLQSMVEDSAEMAPAEEVFEEKAASPEDLAYNRAQYEPMMRMAWEAGKAFDDFVVAELGEECAADGRFAVFGSAWRYEVYPLAPTWPTVSADVDLEIDVVGASYAPQDGRYDFDFSDVRLTFDAAAVERGIAAACAEYASIGEAFLAEARADAAGDDVPPNGMRMEQSANAKVGAVRERLEELLRSQAPGGNYALLTALMNGQRVE